MKAIIEVNRRGSVFKAARKQIAQKGRGRTPDFSLTFESARMLFAELTPARLDLLNTLHGMDRPPFMRWRRRPGAITPTSTPTSPA